MNTNDSHWHFMILLYFANWGLKVASSEARNNERPTSFLFQNTKESATATATDNPTPWGTCMAHWSCYCASRIGLLGHAECMDGGCSFWQPSCTFVDLLVLQCGDNLKGTMKLTHWWRCSQQRATVQVDWEKRSPNSKRSASHSFNVDLISWVMREKGWNKSKAWPLLTLYYNTVRLYGMPQHFKSWKLHIKQNSSLLKRCFLSTEDLCHEVREDSKQHRSVPFERLGGQLMSPYHGHIRCAIFSNQD